MPKKQQKASNSDGSSRKTRGDAASRAAWRQRYRAQQSSERWECGSIEPPVDPKRRESTRYDYQRFAQTYFGNIFTLPWSKNHEKAADRIETAVLRGGMFAFAMPRGTGKTTMAEVASLWALCHSHHRFVVFLGATEVSAGDRLESIKVELRCNELLREDFPEITQPIWHLGQRLKQCAFQTCNGLPTAVAWTKKEIVLPTVTDEKGQLYPCSGSIFQVTGITGEIRGRIHKLQDGSTIRPTLAICDDPQTRESARSPSQSETRAQTLAADVAYLPGPGQRISVLVPCTVIYPDDMADRILNRELHPEYHGIRTKMVEQFPENLSLWDQYAEIVKECQRNDEDISRATEFYREHRKEMDRDFEISWPERYREGEISAIQYAMNERIRDEDAFWSEFQNEPRTHVGEHSIMATPDEVLAKVTGRPRLQCPADSTVLTAMIDPKMTCLHWMVCAWSPGMNGQIIDYGVWPEQQGIRILDADRLRRLFDDIYAHRGQKEQVFRALMDCVTFISRQYPIEGGGELGLDRILVDANMGQISTTIYQFCMEARSMFPVVPAHGIYCGATSKPWGDYKRKRGEKLGPHWRHCPSAEWPIRHVNIDVNHWKTVSHQLLKADFGGSGTIGIYGRGANGKTLGQRHHLELADQICAEYCMKVEAKNRSVYEWKEKPNRPPNECLDLLVGCLVGASMEGIELPGSKSPPSKNRPRQSNFMANYINNASKLVQ